MKLFNLLSQPALLLLCLRLDLGSAGSVDLVQDALINADMQSIIQPRGLPEGTCNAATPCENKACCGTNGLCGYSPTECGRGNCTSNCDAKAQCGQYGVQGEQNCPLNVCCSQFGFCGSTDDFCSKKGCQVKYGSCGDPKRPLCHSSSIQKRTVGYYESWASTRKCNTIFPEDLNLNGFTHINFAFAFFDPKTFAIAPMDKHSGSLYGRFTALKETNEGLQTWISIGGWSFTDPGPTREAFSQMASKSSSRATFIRELINFMEHYGFDGADLDWEYPQADDRGGFKADKENFVSLVKDIKAAFVHGTWDAQSKELGPFIRPHTNITEIDLGLDLLWRAGVKPEKVVLGMGWYGRSFTLTDSSCNTPNGICQFDGGAKAAPCSNASGILTLEEIKQVIEDNELKPHWDKKAAVKWITWEDTQWVSYDDDDTFAQKRKFANSRCLGGTMVWAMDQVDQTIDNGLSPAPGITQVDQKDAQQMRDDLAASITCYTTECGKDCKKGTNAVSQMNGQPGKLSTADRCKPNEYRTLCCNDGTTMGTCKWRGFRGVGLSCMGGCADGETEVVQNTNHHENNHDQSCTGGIQSYCCNGFKRAPSPEDLKEAAEEKSKEAAEDAAEQAALDVAAKAFCRVAVPALLAPLEALEALIPIFGEIADAAELAATPGLIILCTNLVKKEGKAVFKVFGKKHTIDGFHKPTKKPSSTRPSKSAHDPAKSKSCDSENRRAMERADEPPPKRHCPARRQRTVHSTIITKIDEEVPTNIGTIMCDAFGNNNELLQPCLNYRSIINHYPQHATITCPFKKSDDNLRTANTDFYNQRTGVKDWDKKQANPPADGCQPDEYPPAVMVDLNEGINLMDWGTNAKTEANARQHRDRPAMVRYIDAKQNRQAGLKLFNRKCIKVAARETVEDHRDDRKTVTNDNFVTEYTSVRVIFTRQMYALTFPPGMDRYTDDGLADNACQPHQDGVDHRGYALLDNDQWFDSHPAAADLTDSYMKPPPFKREWIDTVGLVVRDVNSSRSATQDEIRHQFGFEEPCSDEKCSREVDQLRKLMRETSLILDTEEEQHVPTSAGTQAPEPTPPNEANAEMTSSSGGHKVPKLHIPQETGA